MNTGPHRVEMGEWLSCAPFEKLLNMEIIEATDGRAVLTMPFTLELAQGAGLMHGGALVSLADTAVCLAIKSIVAPLTHFATISLESSFLYPLKEGVVTAEAQVSKVEGRIIKGGAVLYNDDRREIVRFASVFKISGSNGK